MAVTMARCASGCLYVCRRCAIVLGVRCDADGVGSVVEQGLWTGVESSSNLGDERQLEDEDEDEDEADAASFRCYSLQGKYGRPERLCVHEGYCVVG